MGSPAVLHTLDFPCLSSVLRGKETGNMKLVLSYSFAALCIGEHC